MEEDWQADLEQWLVPYLEGLGNKTRRKICPAYIAGLIGPGDRLCCINGVRGFRFCLGFII
ncbi:hypothetical protein GCM10007870_21720 [Gluconobacter kondonii]|uniref:Transposase n=1 Tax=Gluconobacter kondonii TaxID=941463 RepID=A0ABQ5WTM7_9PROT|nr:hypothetical protein GCM10007870_21720 [Gluconobacter kondonii]